MWKMLKIKSKLDMNDAPILFGLTCTRGRSLEPHGIDTANTPKMRDLYGKEVQFEAFDDGTVTDIAARDKLLANCVAPSMLVLKKGAQVKLIKNLTTDLTNGLLGKVIAFMNEDTLDYYEGDPYPVSQIGDKAESASKDYGKIYPLVRFTQADGKCHDLLTQPEHWEVKLPNGEIQARRQQLPLVIA